MEQTVPQVQIQTTFMHLHENVAKDRRVVSKRPLVANPSATVSELSHLYNLLCCRGDASMRAGLNVCPDWTDLPSGVYADQRMEETDG